MNDNDADFWLFLNRDLSLENTINMYTAMDELNLVNIVGPIEQLAERTTGSGKISSVVKWNDSDEIAFFLYTKEGKPDAFLFDGQRQLWLTILEGFSGHIEQGERKHDFTPVFQAICEHVDPFFAFGGHNTMMSEIWYLEDGVNPLDRVLSILGEYSALEYRTMYFDQPLYNSLSKEVVLSWSEIDDEFGSSGHLISSRKEHWDFSEIPYNEVERNKNRVFREHILPHIRKRFIEEYASSKEP